MKEWSQMSGISISWDFIRKQNLRPHPIPMYFKKGLQMTLHILHPEALLGNPWCTLLSGVCSLLLDPC